MSMHSIASSSRSSTIEQMADSKKRTVLVSYGLKSYLIGLSSSDFEGASAAIRQIIGLDLGQSFHLERWVGSRWVYIAPSAWCDEPAKDSLSSTLEYNVVLDGARTAAGTIAQSSSREQAANDAGLLYVQAKASEIDAFRKKLTDARHDELTSTFEATGLEQEVIAGLKTFGFESPSLLQQRILKPLVKGKSLFIVSKPTREHLASFVAGTVDKMHNATPYIVIFVPDRNMAYDVQRMVYMIAGRSGARCLVATSEPVTPEGFHYLVGTPSDLHKTLKYCNAESGGGLDLELVCVFQADAMYSQGSVADLEAAFEHLSIDQFVLYCSTLEPHVLALYQEYAYKYSYVRCWSEEEQIKLASHHIIAAEKDKWKMQAIFNLCVSRADVSGIKIICGDEGRAATVRMELRQSVSDDSPLPHGRLQSVLVVSMDKVDETAATDPEASLAIFFDAATSPEQYVECLAEPRPLAESAVVVNLASAADLALLRTVEEVFGIKMSKMPDALVDHF